MHPEPVNSQVGPMSQHLSFTKLKGRGAAKRKKVNIYTPQLPNTSSIHETYTFVSRKQGFRAHGSHVTVKSSTSSIQFVQEMDSIMTDSHTNHDFSYFTGADIETECLETEDDPKTKCTPLQSWQAEHDTFLLELLRHDGRGDYVDLCVCGSCHFGLPEYRCIDCFSGELFCSACIVSLHASNPHHQIQASFCIHHLDHTYVCAEMDGIFICSSVTQTARLTGTTWPSDWRGVPIAPTGIQ